MSIEEAAHSDSAEEEFYNANYRSVHQSQPMDTEVAFQLSRSPSYDNQDSTLMQGTPQVA